MTFTYGLLEGSSQIYYSRVKSEASSNLKTQEAISLVQGVRYQLLRVRIHKLYHMLQEPLQALHIGRYSLFTIMKANHLNISSKRQYQITTNSHHRFRKHKNLIENLEVNKPGQVWVSETICVGSRKDGSNGGRYISQQLINDSDICKRQYK